ncbi:nucleotide exchange factor GrpE [Okibacterium endophyticum]
MTDQNPTPEENGDEVQPQGEGSEAQASGPEPQVTPESEAVAPDPLDDAGEADDLTVQDILDAAGDDQDEASVEGLAAELARVKDELAREQASFFNFRRAREAQAGVERDRTRGDVVKVLLPVLDDLDRAEKHGDLEGDTPFATIAGKLRATVQKLGLTSFGAAGDPFDPNLHEAIFQQPTPDVSAETVLDVVETGYRIGDTLVRAAKVVVAVPAE